MSRLSTYFQPIRNIWINLDLILKNLDRDRDSIMLGKHKICKQASAIYHLC